MPRKQNDLNPQEQARLEQLRAARMAALKRGFDSLRSDRRPALAGLDFLNTETTDLDSLSQEDLAKTRRLFAEIFGQDPEDPAKGLMEDPALLNRFQFRRSPQNDAVEKFAAHVKARLQLSPKFAGRELTDAELLPYAQAELLRQMARPGSQLSYDDGKEKLENISVPVAFPAQEPEQKLEAIRDRSSRIGRNYYQILQELRLPRVGAFELGLSLAGGDEGNVDTLARVYDELFGNDERYRLDRFRVAADQGGLRNAQSLNEIYTEQYHGPAQTPEAKQSFQKALLVNALANGSGLEVTHDGENLPTLEEAFHGETSPEGLRQAARTELLAEHNFSGAQLPGRNNVPLEFGVPQIRQAVGQMLRNINNCDKTLIRSSEAFITMKKNLKALDKLVNETWRQEIEADRPITLEMMSDFLEKADALKGDVRHYLDKKLEDVAADPSRRSDPKSYEQRRIQANIKNLAALGEMTGTVESQVLKGISGKARNYFNKDLELLEARRPDLTAADVEEQKYNVQRTVDRQRQLTEDAYRRHHFGRQESLLQARDRILRNVERKYDAAYRQDLNRNRGIERAVGFAVKDQRIRNITQSNAEIQESHQLIFSDYANLSAMESSERSALENYRYRLLPTDRKTLQAGSGRNATVLPAKQREGISFLEDLYGFTPNLKQKYLFNNDATDERNEKHPQTGKYISILTDEPVRHDFKAIYRGGDPAEAAEEKLSEKDFVALAVAGARTPQSFALSGQRSALLKNLQDQKITREQYDEALFELDSGYSAEDMRLRKIDNYSISKCDTPYATDAFCKENFPCIQNGRKLASRAMEAYEAGNLKPLAKLIAFGVTDIVATNRGVTAAKFQASAAEICKRMSNMLERDPELKKEAFRQGLQQQDLDMIDSMTMQSMIHHRANYGQTLWRQRPDLVTGDIKLSVMADMYINCLMEAQYENLKHNVLDRQPSSVNAVNAAEQAYIEAKEAGDARKKYILQNMKRDVHLVEAMKLRYRDKFAETITKPGVYDKLRHKVFKMLRETEFQNMDYARFLRTIGGLGTLKEDTGMTSTLSYLQNYDKQPKNEDGLYKVKTFRRYHEKTYEEEAAAFKAIEEYLAEEAENQSAQAGGAALQP